MELNLTAETTQLNTPSSALFELRNRYQTRRLVWFVYDHNRNCKAAAEVAQKRGALTMPPGAGLGLRAKQAAEFLARYGQKQIVAMESQPFLNARCVGSRNEILVKHNPGQPNDPAKWVELNLLVAGVPLEPPYIDPKNVEYAQRRGGRLFTPWEDQQPEVRRGAVLNMGFDKPPPKAITEAIQRGLPPPPLYPPAPRRRRSTAGSSSSRGRGRPGRDRDREGGRLGRVVDILSRLLR